ncbi:MAG: ArnT family glycosyltransferase [Chloroflexota bacterium]
MALAGLACCGALAMGLGTAELRMTLLIGALGSAGVLAERAIQRSPLGDSLDVALRASCLTLVIVLIAAGLVHLIPGPVDVNWLISAIAAAIVMFGLASLQQHGTPWSLSRQTLVHMVCLLALGGPLRLLMLGYSELQGDEARVMNRATAMFLGVDAAPLVHHKGPGELLLAMFWGGVVDRVAEADARFPFALTSVLGILAIYAAGRSLFNPQAGLIAGALWAINGYGVALGRIVQYHSLVILLTSTALVCAAAGARDVTRSRSHWLLAFIFLSAAGVCGFNAPILGLPAVLMMLTRVHAELGPRRRVFLLKTMIAALTVFAVIATLIVLAAPQVAREWLEYGLERIGRGQPFNNLDLFVGVSSMYASLPYLAVSLIGGCVAVIWFMVQAPDRRAARWVAAIALVCASGVLVSTRGQPTWLALLVWIGFLASTLAAPAHLDRAWRIISLSVLLPLGAYLFLIVRPGTHWYEIFPALTLLVGGACAALPRPRQQVLTWIASVTGTLIILLIAVYPAYTFLPRVQDALPLPFSELYRPTTGPLRGGGIFGFPHQEGWKALAALHHEGVLAGPLQTNQWQDVARWYLPEVEWCSRAPTYVLAPTATQPRRNPAGSVTWIIRSEGPKAMLVFQPNAEGRAFKETTANDSAGWFDAHRATFHRLLNVDPRNCPRMSPSWDPYNAAS